MIRYSSNAVPVGQRVLLEVLRYYVRLEQQSSKPAPPHPGLHYGMDLIAFLRTVDLSIRALPDEFSEQADQQITSPSLYPAHLQQEKLTLGDPFIWQICQAVHCLETDLTQAPALLTEIGTLLEKMLAITLTRDGPPPRAGLFRLIQLDARELLLVDTLVLLCLEVVLRESTFATNLHFNLRSDWQILADRWTDRLSSLPVSDLSTCSPATRRQLSKLERLAATEQHPSVQMLTEALTLNASEQGDDRLEEIHTRLLLRYIRRTVELLPTTANAESSPDVKQAGETAMWHAHTQRQRRT